MIAIRRTGLVLGLILAVAVGWSQVALALAAPATKAAVGVAYQTTGGNPVGNANYTVVADMVVPAGKYHVTARGTVNNQTGVATDVSCNARANSVSVDAGTASVPLQYARFAIDGTADLPAGGTILIECISTTSAAPFPTVGVSIVAESVAGIVPLP